MNWGLIPEVFFDLIARLVPGSIFLVGAFAVYFGPKTFAESLPSALPSVNLASLLLFGLLAYFVAIVLKEIWEFGAWFVCVGAAKGKNEKPSTQFRDLPVVLRIRSRMPAEASWLLKIKAEKNICEVLVPGLAILFLCNLWLFAARPSGDLIERIALGLVLGISGVACWHWRKCLECLFLKGLKILYSLSEEEKS